VKWRKESRGTADTLPQANNDPSNKRCYSFRHHSKEVIWKKNTLAKDLKQKFKTNLKYSALNQILGVNTFIKSSKIKRGIFLLLSLLLNLNNDAT
jgi:hypothetical protein